MIDRPLKVLHVCDHLGWEGSRMHGVKRLFAWMLPRFDPALVKPALISLRRRDLSEETLDSLGVDISYLMLRGIFGAPTFFSEDGEMFWGNDRLEQALAWTAGERPGKG